MFPDRDPRKTPDRAIACDRGAAYVLRHSRQAAGGFPFAAHWPRAGIGVSAVAADLLATHLYRYGSRRTLFVTGELDVATAPALEGAVDAALDGQDGELALVFSAPNFMGAARARGLLDAP